MITLDCVFFFLFLPLCAPVLACVCSPLCMFAWLVMFTVLVYADRGTSPRFVRAVLSSVRQLFPSAAVRPVFASELVKPGWESSTAAIVFPGGRDIPYLEELRGAGNARIRRYVHDGGVYIGFCAGAYYASDRISFEAGSNIQVIGDRELGFFPGLALGAVARPYTYSDESGACLVPLRRFHPGSHHDEEDVLAYSNGGCAFILDEKEPRSSNVETLARYCAPVCERQGLTDLLLPAVVRVRVGQGVAVLSGVHPELSPQYALDRIAVAAGCSNS